MKKRTILLTLLTVCWMLVACNTETKTVDSCGDGFVDPEEECDGDVGENSCQSLGYYNALGELRCNPDCTLDDSSCGGRCGDGLVQEPDGETCDGGNLNGQTCQSLGYSGGTLACGAGCTYDLTACASRCGNGVIDAEDGEVCDGVSLAGQTCETQGYHGGELVCEADCSGYNLGNCVAIGRCGDGVLQANFGELCDGQALDGHTCQSEGYYGGTLACSVDCHQLDLTDCEAVGRCGDGVIQSDHGEDCEDTELGGQTCVGLGYSARSGELACFSECLFDERGCLEKSDNADLSTLTVSSGTLSPAFSPATTSYAMSVTMEVTTLTVTATAADAPYATVAITPVQPMTLVEGINLATVTVTAEDGTSKPYTVSVTRQDYLSPNIGTLKYVPAGTFQRDANASNLSVVSAFRMSRHEITRAQWTAVTGWTDPSDVSLSSGTNDPVQKVNWYHAIAFCNKLSLLEGLTPVYTVSGVNFSTLTYAQIPTVGNTSWNAATANWAANGYRLPTEMEWMWAAMGADTANPGAVNTTGYAKAFAGSTGANVIGDYAVFGYITSESGRTTTERSNPVGSKLANELGLYDLSGNILEWGWDWYLTYPAGTLTDYRGPASGTERVRRGGSWYAAAASSSVANRGSINPFYQGSNLGFRVVRN